MCLIYSTANLFFRHQRAFFYHFQIFGNLLFIGDRDARSNDLRFHVFYIQFFEVRHTAFDFAARWPASSKVKIVCFHRQNSRKRCSSLNSLALVLAVLRLVVFFFFLLKVDSFRSGQ